jgi:hypothetical protein
MDLDGIGTDFEVEMEGFRAGGGGLDTSALLELGRIGRGKEGFGDKISGDFEDFWIKGLALAGMDLSCDGAGFTVAFVEDVSRPDFFPSCGVAFCSKMPIKEVVGGIEVVSRT